MLLNTTLLMGGQHLLGMENHVICQAVSLICHSSPMWCLMQDLLTCEVVSGQQ